MGPRRNLEDLKRSFRPDEDEEEEDEEEEEEEEEGGEEDEDEEESESKRIRATAALSFPSSERRYVGSASVTRTDVWGSSMGRTIVCQADNCTANMTEAKKYHRRHKVCEFHAKAPVVPVAGIHQRFCQQCSRFHELLEFDEAKRSCRRRLVGHNERRRKSSYDYSGDGSN